MRIVRPAVALAVVSLLLPFAAGPAAAATAATAAELNATESYVLSVYEDLFTRAPDPAGLQTWRTALLSGAPRIVVANAITSSEEFRSGLIIDAYAAYLGRGPDAAGLQSWLRNMGAGLTVEQLDAGFIASDEYWAAAGGNSADWVRALYADVLGRDAGDAEVSLWVAALNGGTTRAQAAMGFLLSTEYLSSVVAGYYQWLLNRGPDPTGRSGWVSAIQHGGNGQLSYDPENPIADANGYIRRADVNLPEQMGYMIVAERAFQANAHMVDTAKETYQAAIAIGKGV